MTEPKICPYFLNGKCKYGIEGIGCKHQHMNVDYVPIPILCYQIIKRRADIWPNGKFKIIKKFYSTNGLVFFKYIDHGYQKKFYDSDYIIKRYNIPNFEYAIEHFNNMHHLWQCYNYVKNLDILPELKKIILNLFMSLHEPTKYPVRHIFRG